MKKTLQCYVAIIFLTIMCIPPVFSNAEQEQTQTESGTSEIVIWCWDYVEKAMAKTAEKFQYENPDIKIIFEIMDTGDVYQKLLLAITAGVGMPDVVALESSHLAQFVKIGALEDITDAMVPYKDDMNEFKWLDASDNGHIFAMPMDSGPVAMYYRRDIFEKAGLPSSPEEVEELLGTWDDYYDVARIIKDKTGANMFSDSFEQPTLRNFEKMMFQNGIWYFDENDNVTINNPIIKDILQYIKKFKDEDLLDNSIEWTQAWYDSFANGTVATHFGAIWMSGFLKGWIAPDTVGLWGIVPLPQWTVNGSRTANDGGSNFAIPLGASNPHIALKFMEYALGNVENVISMATSVEQFPSYIPAYDNEYFKQSDPFYRGQKAVKVFTDAIIDAPKVAYTRNYSLANEIMQSIFLEYMYGDISVDKALVKAETQLLERMVK